MQKQLAKHYEEGIKAIGNRETIGCFLQGSQNYGLDTKKSDVDSRLLILPTLNDLAMNKKPISTTHIMDNKEHIDLKDIRLFMQNIKKQNMNSLEILFTDYKILSPKYKNLWEDFISKREEIARLNPYAAIKSMQGIAHNKYKYLTKPTESKTNLFEEFGYDPKQLHHLLRIAEYISRYVSGEPYEDCLKSKQPDYLKNIKLQPIQLKEAEEIAIEKLAYIDYIAMVKSKKFENFIPSKELLSYIDEFQYNFIKTAVISEIKGDDKI